MKTRLAWLLGSALLFATGALYAAEDADDSAADDSAADDSAAADSRKSDEPESSEEGGGESESKHEAKRKKDDDGEPSYGHGRQFGLRVGLVGAYRMVLRYDASPYCHAWMADKTARDQPQFCGFGAPLAVDLALSGALIDAFEPFVWARLGFSSETPTNTKPLVILGAGARIYTMADSAFKIFVEPAVGLEIEGRGSNPDPNLGGKLYRNDIVFHLAAGPHYDIAKNFGLYLDAGLTVGILRYLQSTLELTGGLQGRLP